MCEIAGRAEAGISPPHQAGNSQSCRSGYATCLRVRIGKIRRLHSMIYFVAVGFATLLSHCPTYPHLTFFHQYCSTAGNFGILQFDVCMAVGIKPLPTSKTSAHVTCSIMLLLNSGEMFIWGLLLFPGIKRRATFSFLWKQSGTYCPENMVIKMG